MILRFDRALTLKALPIPTENSMVFNLAQLNMQLENYQKAITLLESRRADHRARADELLNALLPHSGGSFRLGISGVPGGSIQR